MDFYPCILSVSFISAKEEVALTMLRDTCMEPMI